MSPGNFSLTYHTNTTVNFTWSLVPADEFNGVPLPNIVELKCHLNNGTLNEQLFDVGLLITSIEIADLFPGTSCQSSIKSCTHAGCNHSPVIDFTTNSSVPTGTVKLLSLAKITSTCLIFTWQSIQPMKRNSLTIEYVIILFSGENKSACHVTDNTFIEICQLTKYHKYNATIYARNNAGKGHSLYGVYQTEQDVPESAPLNFSLNEVKSREINISWTQLHLLDFNGQPLRYSINRTCLLNNGSIHQAIFNVSLNMSSMRVGDLFPATFCRITIAACTIAACKVSHLITFTTLEEAPSTSPQSVIITNLTSNCVLLLWKEIPIIERKSKESKFLISVIGIGCSKSYKTEDRSLKICNLKGFRIYHASIRGNNNGGVGPASDLSFTTEEDGTAITLLDQ